MGRQDENDALAVERMRLEQEAKRLELMERQLALQERQVEAQATQMERTAPKENQNYKPDSPFIDPDTGVEYREMLKCDIFDGPIKLNRTSITKAELDALNRLRPVEKALLIKTDGSSARATVRGHEDAVGRIDKLVIERPMKKDDNPHHYPSLESIATQLADQAPTAA